jgi:hypothetical protein
MKPPQDSNSFVIFRTNYNIMTPTGQITPPIANIVTIHKQSDGRGPEVMCGAVNTEEKRG